MTKSDEYREMQISSGQLAAVILVLLALCVFVFYLGTRVGMKKAAALSPVAAKNAPVETVSPPKLIPPVSETAGKKPAESKAAPAKVESGKPKNDDQAIGTKPKPAEDKPPAKTEPKPAGTATKPPAAEPKVATPSGTYYIQAGALDTRPKGEEFAQKIETLGFRAIVLNPLAGDKRTVYRIRVGPYETKEAAQTALTKLAEVLKRKASEFFLVKG